VHVIATAGHVDHGKSALVCALTGMEPDRLAEEQRRGLTLDLGFAWTDLPSGQTVAFVDVPGHERFVTTMLAGVGPVPAALLVVAADEGWMPQSAEHLAALDALGVRHGVLAVTRTDLADPAPAAAQARAHLAGTGLRDAETVMVSASIGAGLDALRSALDRLVATLPAAEAAAPVRLWVDRSFTIHGSGTVVTGTLRAGTLRVGDELELAPADGTGTCAVRVRGLQSLGRDRRVVTAVARVAVNLRGVDRDHVRRGSALLAPAGFHTTDQADVRIHGDPVSALPATATVHIGSAAVPVRIRPLGADTARLRLRRRLPLHVGDRALLRDPGRHHIAGALTVLDPAPPALRRRGAAARRAEVLAGVAGTPDEWSELRRRRLVTRRDLARMGVPVTAAPVAGEWLADPQWWREQRGRLRRQVESYLADHPLAGGVPMEVLRRALGLPERALVEALVAAPLALADGMVTTPDSGLPAPVRRGVDALRAELATRPFQAPPAARLAALGLGARELAAAARVGEIIRIADGVVLAPDAPAEAVPLLATLPQPFTLSQARQVLGTSRRVAVPLLELLDRQGVTRRLPDDRRTLPTTPLR
jgi:selenocysteine-specific elongation factor